MSERIAVEALGWSTFEILRRALDGSAVEPSLAIEWADRLIAGGLTDDALVRLAIATPGDERGLGALMDAVWRALGVDLADRAASYGLLFDLLASAIGERELPAYDLVLAGMFLAGDTFHEPAAQRFKVFYQVENDLERLLFGLAEERTFDPADPAAWVLAQLDQA